MLYYIPDMQMLLMYLSKLKFHY